MSNTPFENLEILTIGTVDFVSPDEIKVLLDIGTPESVALNAGSVRPFPRVNSYVLLPVDDAFLVGQVEWLTIERSAFPKRHGVRDFGVVDLPFPLRKMSVNPLGTLYRVSRDGNESLTFSRGAEALPSVGTAVLLPTEEQLRSIVESGQRRRVRVGTSALAGNAEICIDPDRLFGRHLAVLGNTGSGKSCSVAGLIRWSLASARDARNDDHRPNARFIVLDPNGEYARAFKEGDGLNAKVFKVGASDEDEESALSVPLWLWNSAEWIAFTQASTKTQKPTLVQALRLARDSPVEIEEESSHSLRRYLRTLQTIVKLERNAGTPWGPFPRPKAFFEKLEKWRSSLELELASLEGEQREKLGELVGQLERLCEPRREKYPDWDFTREEIDQLLNLVMEAHFAFGGSESDTVAFDVDAPRTFTGDELLRCVEATAEMLNVSEYVETLIIRIRSLLSDTQMKAVIGDTGLNLVEWLSDYIGGEDSEEESSVRVIDLSLVPSEIIHIVTAVTARVIFESLRRYRKLEDATLPTVLVMEEAHTFVKRYRNDLENYDAGAICCQVFERIAREGRKFGLGLVLSSQRPSELSPTVLSQCNTFLLHRISNDRDQDLVHRFVPDNLRGLLRELPSLPSQHAILLGWASELPVLMRVDDLPTSHQPHSEDPDYWDVWIGRNPDDKPVTRDIGWKRIVEDWQGRTIEEERADECEDTTDEET